jgi:hypothetical protein
MEKKQDARPQKRLSLKPVASPSTLSVSPVSIIEQANQDFLDRVKFMHSFGGTNACVHVLDRYSSYPMFHCTALVGPLVHVAKQMPPSCRIIPEIKMQVDKEQLYPPHSQGSGMMIGRALNIDASNPIPSDLHAPSGLSTFPTLYPSYNSANFAPAYPTSSLPTNSHPVIHSDSQGTTTPLLSGDIPHQCVGRDSLDSISDEVETEAAVWKDVLSYYCGTGPVTSPM